MDSVIIFGETEEQHDERLIEVLCRLAQAGVTLNEKCEFSKRSLKYLGLNICTCKMDSVLSKLSAQKTVQRPNPHHPCVISLGQSAGKTSRQGADKKKSFNNRFSNSEIILN